MFMAHVNHGGRSALAGWECVDGLHGDKTEMDIMGPWSVYFGMLKKMADIRFLPVGLGELEITVTRRGVRLVTMRLKMGEELAPNALALVNDGFASCVGSLDLDPLADIPVLGINQALCFQATSDKPVFNAMEVV